MLSNVVVQMTSAGGSSARAGVAATDRMYIPVYFASSVVLVDCCVHRTDTYTDYSIYAHPDYSLHCAVRALKAKGKAIRGMLTRRCSMDRGAYNALLSSFAMKISQGIRTDRYF